MGKKIIITEEQSEMLIREIIKDSNPFLLTNETKYYTGKNGVFWSNIFLLSEQAEYLYEGIFATYPIDKVREYLLRYYKLPDEYVTINGEETLTVCMRNTEENKTKMDKSLALCGYFPSYVKEIHGGDGIVVDYEKRINDDANSLVRKRKFIYHITPSIYIDSILKNGLCPKTKNKQFKYPERIYFYLDKLDPMETKEFGKMLYQYIEQDDYTRQNKLYDNFALLQINVKDLGEHKFYKDPNLDNAVYTTENISPEAIYVKYRNITVK